MKNYKPEDFNILIVDDIQRNLDVLSNLLKNEKYSFETAKSGKEAIEKARKKNFDIILLDIMMPEMNGYEVAKHLKQDYKFKDVPIIFITAITDTESIVVGLEAGGVDYITKPFNEAELLARLKTHLELKKSKDIIARNYYKLEVQKQEIELQNYEITAGINYASKIQNALLPSDKIRYSLLPQHFIIWIPKTIVSGDFYWIKKFNSTIISAVVDCTGHGVPGAFMSLLGIAFLNEIVKKDNVKKPDFILNNLRKQLKNSLGQTGIDGEPKDGMDVSLISIDFDSKKLYYAGANNSIYLIRKKDKPQINLQKIKKTSANNFILTQIIHDAMPIGIYHVEKNFTMHTVDILEGDLIYAFTDGYIDQFGGENDKKFKSKQFKKLLLNNCQDSLKKQKQTILTTFKEWKGRNEQVDDILIMGIKI